LASHQSGGPAPPLAPHYDRAYGGFGFDGRGAAASAAGTAADHATQLRLRLPRVVFAEGGGDDPDVAATPSGAPTSAGVAMTPFNASDSPPAAAFPPRQHIPSLRR
jgi:hypothetical protein